MLQLGEATEALRMGLRVEQRSDLKKLLEIITKYIEQAGRDLQDASSEVSRLQQANRELFEKVHSLGPQAQADLSSQVSGGSVCTYGKLPYVALTRSAALLQPIIKLGGHLTDCVVLHNSPPQCPLTCPSLLPHCILHSTPCAIWR